jgi:hypothetical protein
MPPPARSSPLTLSTIRERVERAIKTTEKRSGQDQAIGLQFQKRFEGGGLSLRDPFPAVEERPVTTFESAIFDSVDHVGEEGIVEVGEHDSEHIGPLPHEAARHRVRSVAEFVGRLEHCGASLVADVGRLPHHE